MFGDLFAPSLVSQLYRSLHTAGQILLSTMIGESIEQAYIRTSKEGAECFLKKLIFLRNLPSPFVIMHK